MIKISGVVETVIFSNPENGYSVCEVAVGDELITMTGMLPDVAEGEKITASGEWVTHAEYGDQFSVEYSERVMPATEEETEKFLASGLLPHIGKTTAKRIVEAFGADALDIIENDPDRLLEIKGMSPKKVDEIHLKYIDQIAVRNLVIFFQEYGISPAGAVKAYQILGAGAKELIEKNPYLLSDLVDGITFEKTDKMALSMGFDKKGYQRISAGISCLLEKNGYLSGHAYLPKPILISQAASFLEVDKSVIEDNIAQMLLDEKITLENCGDYDAIYLALFYDAEQAVAERLKKMSSIVFDVDYPALEKMIESVESEIDLELADMQIKAIHSVFESQALVITGGPGTGKTTIINSIIRIMELDKKSVLLAAPTGRAAKRMSEVCSREAKTIHRLLEVKPGIDEVGSSFARNAENPLDCDVLIVDEMSMVDILMMRSILEALPDRAKLIMVGDSDQLRSVGAGNVLQDIIESGTVNCIRLTEIFRQANESMIVVNAHRINHGEMPLINDKDNDFFFVYRDEPASLCQTIADLCVRRLPRYYGFHSISQIQVLTPTRKTEVGTVYLNEILQQSLNPPAPDKPEHTSRSRTFRLGDKVMHIKNNYHLEWRKIDGSEKGLGVFNGDVGYITEINKRDKYLVVTYDDRNVKYDFIALDELELAYAITVHKSQGSEFDVVVMPMFEVSRLLMTRNLFYTAVTRAKSLVVLVGQERVMKEYVDNNNIRRRFSGLKDKLRID